MNTHIEDLCTINPTFPELPDVDFTLPRDVEVKHLEDKLADNSVVFVDGKEGIGLTTMLALFAKNHPYDCISFFYDGYTRALLRPETIEECLVNQLSFYLKEDVNAYKYPEYGISALSIKIMQRIKQKNKPLYFLFDGLNTISSADYDLIRPILTILPWGKAKFIFSGKQAEYNNLLPKKIRKIQANELLAFPQSVVADYFRKICADITNDDCYRLSEITKNEASKIDYVQRKYEQLGSLDSILESKEDLMSEIYSIEIEQIESFNEPEIKILLGVVAFSERILTKSVIQEVLTISVEALDVIIEKCKDYIFVKEDQVYYISASFRKFMVVYLKESKTQIENLLLKVYRTHGLDYSDVILPLFKQYDQKGLLNYLSSENVETLLETDNSHALLNSQYEYGFQTAVDTPNYIGDAFRFAVAKAASLEIEKNELWDFEIEALIANGKTEEAISLAQNIYLKEEKLKALSLVLALSKTLVTSEKDSIKSEIKILCNDISFEYIPNKAIEIAKILLPIDFALSMEIIEKVVEKQKHSIDVDKIYAAISLSLNEDAISDDQHSESKKFESIKSKIKNEGLRNFTEALNSSNHNSSVEEVMKKVMNLPSNTQQISFLRYWIPEHKNDESIEIALEYAIKLLIDSSSMDIPKVSVIYEMSKVLPSIQDQESFEKILKLIESIESNIKTPTQDYVELKLLIIESLRIFDGRRASNYLDDLYLYVCSLENSSTKIDSKAIILSKYDKLGSKEDLNKSFYTETQLLTELENEIKAEFLETAYHFKIVQRSISELVCKYPSFIRFISPLINTEERRYKTYLYAAKEYVKKTDLLSIDWEYLTELIGGTNKYRPEGKDDIYTFIASKLKKTEYSETLDRELKKKREDILRIEDSSDKCYVLSQLYSWYLRNNKNDSYANNILSELKRTWEAIKTSWIRINIGFHLSELLSDLNSDESLSFLNDTIAIKNELVYSTFSNLTALLGSIDLFTRSIGVLIRSKYIEKEMLVKYENLLNTLKLNDEKYIYWGKISLEYYITGDEATAKRVVTDKILKTLNIDNMSVSEQKNILYNIAPALFIHSAASFFSMIKKYPSFFKDACINHILQFILYKYAYVDEVDNIQDGDYVLTYNEILYLIDLAKNATDETIIFKTIEAITKGANNKASETLSVIQRTRIKNEVTEIISNQLPAIDGIKHDGYKIACLMSVDALQRNKLNKADCKKYEESISNIPNTADKAFLYFYSLQYIDNNTIRTEFLKKGFDLASSIKSGYDKFTRFNMCLIECMDEYRSKFPEYYKAIAIALKGDKDADLSYGEKMIDLAYQFEDSNLVDTYMTLHDDDPARLEYKNKLGKQLVRKKRIAEAAKDINTVTKLNPRDCSSFFEKQFGKLISNKLIAKDAWDIHSVLKPIYLYPFTDSRYAILYFMESVYQKDRVSKNQKELLIKMNDALLFNVKMVMALSTKAKENLTRIYNISSNSSITGNSVINPGESTIGYERILNWFRANPAPIIQIIDPYFDPDDLLFLKNLFDIENDLKIRLLIIKKTPDLLDYRDSWKQKYSEMSGSIEIVSVNFETDTSNGPIHDRYWISVNKKEKKKTGLKTNSLSGIGKKASSIDDMSIESINDTLSKIWEPFYTDNDAEDTSGKKLVYDKVFIS